MRPHLDHLKGPTALYRLYDREGNLLYIGIAKNPEKRFDGHATNTPWWHLVARRVVMWLPTRDEALAAENKACTREKPLYDASDRWGGHWHGQPRRKVYDTSADEERFEFAFRAAMARGDFKPGEFVTKRKMGERFSVSGFTAGIVMYRLYLERVLESSKGNNYRIPRRRQERNHPSEA